MSTSQSRAPVTSGLSKLRAVTWASVSVPGDVCPGRTAPIRLSHGKAHIPDPRGVRLPAGVTVEEATHVFGDLYGRGHDVAALDIWCLGANGSAASQLEDSWVLFTDAAGKVRSIATLTPREPASARKVAPHVPYFDTSPGDIVIAPGIVTVKELWYRATDHTCCPSGRATTRWRVHGTTFTPSTVFGPSTVIGA